MQVVKSQKSALPSLASASGQVEIKSRTVPLRMYLDPPSEEITLEQFESFGLDRLTVFKHIEKYRALGSRGGKAEEEEWRKVLRETGLDKWDPSNEADKDKLSHFILRIAYCLTDDLRRWFLQQELALFRFRFEQMQLESEVDTFFKANSISFEEVVGSERAAVTPIVTSLYRSNNDASQVGTVRIYKVPFEQAIGLVSQRKVYLSKGWAYIPRNELISIVLAQYRQHLSKELAITFRNLQSVRRDGRVQPLITSLSKQYSSSQYKPQALAGKVSAAQIPMLAKRSFPLCMENLFDNLTADSHLRHSGRMQFGLFLKGMSLEVEEALEFWRVAFSKKVTADKFQKNFAYNIRHMYGKEGKRTSYTPYGCSYIINHGPGGPNEHHGCPFRHFDELHLRTKLTNKRLPSDGVEEIIRLVRGTHYQVACQKYYALTHGVENGKIGNHPNQYVAESMKFYQDGATASSSGVKPEPSSSSSSSAASVAASAAASSSKANELTDEELAAMADMPDF